MSIHWNSLLKFTQFWCAMNAWLTPQNNKCYHWRRALYNQTVWMKSILMICRCEYNVSSIQITPLSLFSSEVQGLVLRQVLGMIGCNLFLRPPLLQSRQFVTTFERFLPIDNINLLVNIANWIRPNQKFPFIVLSHFPQRVEAGYVDEAAKCISNFESQIAAIAGSLIWLHGLYKKKYV